MDATDEVAAEDLLRRVRMGNQAAFGLLLSPYNSLAAFSL